MEINNMKVSCLKKKNKYNQTEKEFEDLLLKHKIPFVSRVKVRLDNDEYFTESEFDYIIPGAIVEVKKKFNICRKHIKQLLRFIAIIPQDYKVYIYTPSKLDFTMDDIHNRSFPSECYKDDVVKNFLSNIHRFVTINSIDLILSDYISGILKRVDFMTLDVGILRSLSKYDSDVFETLPCGNGKKIYTTIECYNKAISMSSDQEIEKIANFEINIISKENIENFNGIKITGKNIHLPEKDELFNILPYHLDYRVPRLIHPKREVCKISEKCQNCGNFFFIESKEIHLSKCSS